jgi:hypothetical protein
MERLEMLDYAEAPAAATSTGVVHHNAARSWPGLTLATFCALHRAELIDSEGHVVRSWMGPEGIWRRAILTPGRDLVVVGVDAHASVGTKSGRELLRFDWEGGLLWRRKLPVHHALALDPEGRVTALTSRLRDLPARFGGDQVIDNGVAVVDAQGEIIEERSLLDMLMARPDVFQPRGDWAPDTKLERDVLHANYLEWLDARSPEAPHPFWRPGLLLVTLRRQDTVAVFDWTRRQVIWAWGQGQLVGPHDATLLASGNLLVFDNRARTRAAKGGWSRIVEFDPRAETIVWEYRAEPPEAFFSGTRGTVQRLPNGNTLIGENDRGRAFEVTPDGDVVWDYRSTHRDDEGRPAAIRVQRYDEALRVP